MSKDNRKIDKRLPAAERKKIILDTAARTFEEFGYHGAHMDTIARRAGVTKPILYRHFPSKAKLLLSIIDRDGKELVDSFAKDGVGGISWRDSIERDVKSYLDFVESHKSGYKLVYTIGLSVDKEVSERLHRIRRSVREIVADRIRAYADVSSLSPEEFEMAVVLVVGMTETTAIYWTSDSGVSREACEKSLIQAITFFLSRLAPPIT